MNVSALKHRNYIIRLFFDTYEYKHKLSSGCLTQQPYEPSPCFILFDFTKLNRCTDFLKDITEVQELCSRSCSLAL